MFNMLQRSLNMLQGSLNMLQRSWNMLQRSLNVLSEMVLTPADHHTALAPETKKPAQCAGFSLWAVGMTIVR
jgi:prefoldin subunit 5